MQGVIAELLDLHHDSTRKEGGIFSAAFLEGWLVYGVSTHGFCFEGPNPKCCVVNFLADRCMIRDVLCLCGVCIRH